MNLEMIRKTLVHGSGDFPDSSAIAEATLSTWHQVAVRLGPVIGSRGVEALFNRSLHITSKSYPWLAVDESGENFAFQFPDLRARIALREPVDAEEASHTLLVNFTELLATLIGESLTMRLLEPVWVAPAPESEQEKAS